jgi:SAM-dependent methyltransferase
MTTTRPAALDPGNVAADAAFNGPDGDFWATNAEVFDDSLSNYRRAFLDATRIRPTDRVLDIGCGNGQSTLDAARLAGKGTVLGVDLSEPMLDVARARAAHNGITNVTFLRTDAQAHPFEPESFDAAISHTGAMFFADPRGAFANIARALRTDGTLTLLVWQAHADNDWFRELSGILAHGRPAPTPPPDVPGPFSLADPVRATSILDASGYSAIQMDRHRQPMRFGKTVDDALAFITALGVFRSMLDQLDDAARGHALDQLRANIGAHQDPDGVLYPSAMWTITALRS